MRIGATPAAPLVTDHSTPAASFARATATATEPTSGPTSAVPEFPATAPDTPACRALWAALAAAPGAATADLARSARIGRSTATKLLTILDGAGLVARARGGRSGRLREPDRWTITASVEPPRAPVVEVAAQEACCLGDGADAVRPTGPLARGQLRDLVATHLRTHPDLDFTTTALSNVLNRSAGAIANACQRLVRLGLAQQTGNAPRRYRAAVPDAGRDGSG
jgi:predicted transcriptional regulator